MKLSLIPVFVIVILAFCPGCSEEDSPHLPPSSTKEITTFRFLAADNPALSIDVVATIDGTDITAVVPEGTDRSALVATFTTNGREVRVGATEQISGATANDYAAAVVYTVVARDASTQDYTVTVTELSGAKDITALSFLAADNAALDVDVTATIAGTGITAVVPEGTDRSALVASFTTTGQTLRAGATDQVSGVTANDFSAPVIYTVTAEDASTRDYTVTVVDQASANTLTAFSFLAADNPALAADVTATIDGADVSAVVPEGTVLTALVATFTTTGQTVRVGPTDQVSGVTANDFSAPVTYTVVAENAATRDYTVTVSALSSAREITAFGFLAVDNAVLADDVTATVAGATITAVVPAGTDRTALVASFTTTGQTVLVGAFEQTSRVTAVDFSSPATYTVVAEDASTRDYTVTVSEAASTTWFGDYTIRNAADMAAISGYTAITGYLLVSSDLADLDGLSDLATVGGMLNLSNNAALTDIGGLAALTSVGARLEIFNNGALTNINGLGNIATIGTSLEISANDLLVDLGGLSGLTAVGTSVEIVYNAALQGIAGLGNLATIPGSLTIERNESLTSLAGLGMITALGMGEYDVGLEITDNDALVDLVGLDNLASVTGSVDLNHNDLLASLDGLGNLATVGEDLSLNNNAALSTLAHLTSLTDAPSLVIGTDYFGGNPSLTTVDIPTLESAGILFIEDNLGLVDLTGLTALASIGELYVNQNPVLTTLGFGAASATPLVVTGSISMYRNDLLEDLDGLDATTAMTGWVKLVDHAALNSLAAFDQLVTLGGYLQIGASGYSGHPSLPDLGFGALSTIGGHLYVIDNDHASLTSLAFGSLQSVGGSIIIYQNASLRDVAGLANLTAVGGDLIIGENDDLHDLSALAGVTTVQSALVVDTNGSLNTLTGLDNVATVGWNLEIRDNYELLHLNSLGSLTSLGGSIEIDRNYDMTQIDGLAGLTSIGPSGRLMVMNNTSLANIDGLSGVQTVGGQVWITSNGISRLDLSSLLAATRDLRIQNNTNLSNIDLRSLVSVATDLLIDNTSSLTSLRCDALTSIGRDIYIRNAPGLADLSFLAGFAVASDALGGDLNLTNCSSLTDISVLNGFSSMAGDLDITNNDGLTSLDAFSNFTSIPGTVWVRDNARIGDLTGLASIASIGGILMVDDNASLTALGLDALSSLTWDLYVRDNASLCADRATDLETQLVGHGWTRTAYLSGNTGACP